MNEAETRAELIDRKLREGAQTGRHRSQERRAGSRRRRGTSQELRGHAPSRFHVCLETGVEELDQEKLPELLKLKYMALDDAKRLLGTVEAIRNVFMGFQPFLYEQGVTA